MISFLLTFFGNCISVVLNNSLFPFLGGLFFFSSGIMVLHSLKKV